MTIDGLTATQAKQLLHKHLTGDWLVGVNRIATINSLTELGMITTTLDGKYLVLTDKGKVFCDNHHMEIT